MARGAPDVPLCALALVLGAISTVLASRDQRGLWAAIARAESTSDSRVGSAPVHAEKKEEALEAARPSDAPPHAGDKDHAPEVAEAAEPAPGVKDEERPS